MKTYKTFESMMKYQKGLKYNNKNVKKLVNKYGFNDSDIEEYAGYISIYAYGGTAMLLRNLEEKAGLYVITESIYDDFYVYSRGIGWINRERFLLSKKNDDITLEEEM